MKVFVTGGGGFLGLHLVKKLLTFNYEVVSFSRKHYPELEGLGVKHVQGDLSDVNALTNGMTDCDVCFHVASKVAMAGSREDFYKTNVLGTQNIIDACHNAGISYLIHTSTPSVVFGNSSICGGDERLPYPKKYFSLYAETKSLGEKNVIEAHEKKLKTLALRPHLVFGPGDQNLIPGVLEAYDKGKLKIVGNGENLVDVLYIDNAVDAHINALSALQKDAELCGGQAYFIGQGPIKLWSFINDVLKTTGRAPIKDKVSFKLCYLIGFIIEIFNSLIKPKNEKPKMTRFVAMQLAKDHYFSHTKANELLGWQPKVTIHEGIAKTCKYYEALERS